MRTVQLCALSFVCAIVTLAQTDRGVITGTVKDTSGAVVPNAQITATELGTNATYKTRTTTSGDFTVPSLPVGSYQVRVENTGFKTHLVTSRHRRRGRHRAARYHARSGHDPADHRSRGERSAPSDRGRPRCHRGLEPARGRTARRSQRRRCAARSISSRPRRT